MTGRAPRARACLALAAAAAAAALTACGTLRFVDVPSENRSERVDHVVIHFTGEPFAESMRLLTERTRIPVSAHYLVPEPDDPTYPRRRLRVHRLVEERERAWHAGDSHWNDTTSLNARSIGIEIVNGSRCVNVDPGLAPATPENQQCEFRAFDPAQIELVIALLHDILERYPRIDPEDVVGHADIAPARRADPGPTFPWALLYEHGIGAWYDEATVARYRASFEAAPPSLVSLQRALAAYGYDVEPTDALDAQTRFALRAFQMHFRPSDWSGEPDVETAAILFALVEKYRPAGMRDLNARRESEGRYEPSALAP